MKLIYQLQFVFMTIVITFLVFSGCKKEDEEDLKSITDIDGNSYGVVKIGTRYWMDASLKTTKYSNGDNIGTTTLPGTDITYEQDPKYQWAYSGENVNATSYGRLYTWYAVNDSRNICPTGWHVASVDEWEELFTEIGGKETAGNKLKETGDTYWPFSSVGATNEYGFNARAGGYRNSQGSFTYLKANGYWWSSTEEVNPANAKHLIFMGLQPGVTVGNVPKSYGLAVRCVKDN